MEPLSGTAVAGAAVILTSPRAVHYLSIGALTWNVMDSGLRVTDAPYAVVLEIDRPAARNAVDFRVIEGFERALHHLHAAVPALPVVVRGSGAWFASGGDLKEFQVLSGRDAAQMALRMQRVLQAIETLPVPTVAALSGPAIGGGAELSLACDMRVSSDAAYLRFPQSGLGISTGWQGSERLQQIVGSSRALEILLTGRRVDSQEAKLIGLVNHAWAVASFEDELETFLCGLAQSGAAGRAIKDLLRNSESGRTDGSLELQHFERLWDRPERQARMKAVLKPGD